MRDDPQHKLARPVIHIRRRGVTIALPVSTVDPIYLEPSLREDLRCSLLSAGQGIECDPGVVVRMESGSRSLSIP